MIIENETLRLENAIILLVASVSFGLYSIFLGQDINWDLLNYHLYNPYSFLNNRLNVDLAPAGQQTYFNPFLDMVYFYALSCLTPKIIGFIIGFIQGINFFLVYKVSRVLLKNEKWGKIYSLIFALCGVLSVGFLSEIGTVFHDSLISAIMLFSLLLLLSSFDKLKGNPRSFILILVCSGLLAGAGAALKLTASVYALALCVAFLTLPVDWRRKMKYSFIFGISVLFGVLVAGGYWMYNMYDLFGNPVFPYLNNFFHGELSPPIAIQDRRFLPKNIFEKIFYPVIFTVNPSRVGELLYKQFSWLFAYIAILVLLASFIIELFRKTRISISLDPAEKYFLTFFCVSYVLWLNISGIYRYIITLELIIPLLMYVIMRYFSVTRADRLGMVVFVIILTAFNLRGIPDWGRTGWTEKLYRIEANEISMMPEPGVIFLAGQPLAWIVPALDIKTPFVQLVPNMPVTEAYWYRVRTIAEKRKGKMFVILEDRRNELFNKAIRNLSNVRFGINLSHCETLMAYIGTTKREYSYCEVDKSSYHGDFVDLKIENWGPQKMEAGNLPNKQSDGSMGIWIISSKTTSLGKTEVIFDGKPIAATVSKTGLTAAVPADYLIMPGKKQILIRQVSTGTTYPVGVFELKPVK